MLVIYLVVYYIIKNEKIEYFLLVFLRFKSTICAGEKIDMLNILLWIDMYRAGKAARMFNARRRHYYDLENFVLVS